MSVSLKDLIIMDNGFVFDEQTGCSYSTNETGYQILRHIKEGLAEGAVADTIIAEYAVTQDQAERDLAHFMTYLKRWGIIDEQ